MRNVVLASVLAIVGFNAGCFKCGFEGGENRVYARANEMLILCENGGFVALLEDRMVEGFYTTNPDGNGIATNGEDGAIAFDAQFGADGLVTPQLGTSTWTQQDFNQTQLDHSNKLCDDLEFRGWWTQP